jgi:hypothetical protein
MMKILWTNNEGNILLCERNLIQNVQVLLKKNWQKKNPSLLPHGK